MPADDIIIIGPKPQRVRSKLDVDQTITVLRETADALETGENGIDEITDESSEE